MVKRKHKHRRRLQPLPKPKEQQRPPEILTPEEVNALISVCSNRAPTGIRNRALIATLYRTGLRISEALALLPKDIDPRKATVTVLRGKGAKHRTIGIDESALTFLQRWKDTKDRYGIDPRRRVFCTLKGEPIDPSYIRHLLPRLATKAQIQKRVHAHALRHTHAAELAAEGHPINLIQAQLGHTNLTTTDHYLRHIHPHTLINTIKQRQWQT